jgi:hypothetical protein
MHLDLLNTLREGLTSERVLSAQTERHLATHVNLTQPEIQGFFDNGIASLEEYEVEAVFGPLFTPTLQEQSIVSLPLLEHGFDSSRIDQLVAALDGEKLQSPIRLPDEGLVSLPLHVVMIERYVKLMWLDRTPPPEVAGAIADAAQACRAEALALARHRAFKGRERQEWLAAYLTALAQRRAPDLQELICLTDFMGRQPRLDVESLLSAIEKIIRSAENSLETAMRGRVYLSSDVAEHHQFRGQGQLDEALVDDKTSRLRQLQLLRDDLWAMNGVLT